VVKLIQSRPKDYRLDNPLRLRFTHDAPGGARTEEQLFMRIEMLVELLS
jgi:hypothetical protein